MRSVLVIAMLLPVFACSDSTNSGASQTQFDAPVSVGSAFAAEATADRDTAQEFAGPRGRIDWLGGDPAQGRSLFALHCATCHGADGQGMGPAAVALDPKPRDLTEGTFYIDTNDNNVTGETIDLARVILVGPGVFGGSEAMQGWNETLSVDEVRHLVAFVESLSKGRE